MAAFDTDEDELPRPKRVSRRRVVAGVLGVAILAGTGGVLAHRSHASSRREQASTLAKEAYAKLRLGAVASAVKLATDARTLDPAGRDPAFAWMHAMGVSLLEDTGGAKEAVGFVDEVRRLGADGTDLGFCLLASAVALRNDKLAARLVAQHEAQRVPVDAFYALAHGAALDLSCDRGAADSYESSCNLWADAILPRLRLSRAHLIRGRLADARKAVESVPEDAIGRLVIEAAAQRLEDKRARAGRFGSAALDEAPRSLRPLGLALLVQTDDPSAAIDAALDDVDTPLAAIACGKLALIAGDAVSAEAAAKTAFRMRPELSDAASFAVRVALVRGDLDKARELAKSSSDAGVTTLVAAISAYEDKAPEKIRASVEEAMEMDGAVWRVASEARGVLGDGPAPVLAVSQGAPLPPLWAALEEGEPWADVVMFDAAFSAGDLKTCQAVVDRWRELTKPREKRRALLLGKRADIR